MLAPPDVGLPMSLLAEWTVFIGANNNLNPKNLPEGVGVDARNLDTIKGDLRGRYAASQVYALTGLMVQQKTIYRMGRDAPSDTLYWLSWPTDVDVVRSLLATDTTERTYYTGDGAPKFTDNTFLGSPPYPTGSVALGVPAPNGTMTLAVDVAGSAPVEDRVYIDTFVRGNGDESAPNTNPTPISCPGGSSINISTLAAPPGGTIGITKRRIYVSTAGADFEQCVEQTASLTTAHDDGVTRGLVLETGGDDARPAWLTPPDDMFGLIGLWNGMMGGLSGKNWMVCQAYEPHAWPLEYQDTVHDTLVGSATYGQNWVLATTGMPQLVVGSSPAGMEAQPIYLKQACVSKRSVAGVGHGVCWASAEGLAYSGQFGSFLLTESFIDKALWAALVPSSIKGIGWKQWYIGFYNDGTNRKGFMINTSFLMGSGTPAVIWLDQGADDVWLDTVSQSLYLLDTGNVIRKWDSGSRGSASWTSPVKRVRDATCPGAAQVIASGYPVTFTFIADGVTQLTKTVGNSLPFRLPGNYGGGNEFQATVSGVGPTEAVLLAEEMEDLP